VGILRAGGGASSSHTRPALIHTLFSQLRAEQGPGFRYAWCVTKRGAGGMCGGEVMG